MESVTRYIDDPATALYPFGYGLGYTEWQLTDWAVTGERVDDLVLTAVVTNIGRRRGRQLVQLYGRVLAPGRMPRRAILLGYAEVATEPGNSERVAIGIKPDSIPGLGDLAGSVLELWPSISGAEQPSGPPKTSAVRL